MLEQLKQSQILK